MTICGSHLGSGQAGHDSLSFEYSPNAEAIRRMGRRPWGEAYLEVLHTEAGKGYPDESNKWWLDQFSTTVEEGISAFANPIRREDFDVNRIIDKVPMLLLNPLCSPLVNVDDQRKLAKATGASLELIETIGRGTYLDKVKLCQEKFVQILGPLKQ